MALFFVAHFALGPFLGAILALGVFRRARPGRPLWWYFLFRYVVSCIDSVQLVVLYTPCFILFVFCLRHDSQTILAAQLSLIGLCASSSVAVLLLLYFGLVLCIAGCFHCVL